MVNSALVVLGIRVFVNEDNFEILSHEKQQMNESKNEKCVQQDVYYVPVQMMSGSMVENDIDLYELCSILWAGRGLIAGIFFVSMVLASILVFFVHSPKFKAETAIRATEYSQSVIEDYLISSNFKRKLVDQLALLPVIFSDVWDSGSNTWRVKDADDIPSIEQAIKSDNFPYSMSVSKKNKLIYIYWEASDASVASKNLEKCIAMLSEYVIKEYDSDYRVTIKVLQEELGQLKLDLGLVDGRLDDLEDVFVADENLSSAYALLKNKLADQRSKDILCRKFTVVSTPGVPSEPSGPPRILILGGAAFGSLFTGIFAVFLRSVVRRWLARKQKLVLA